jgi:hypothetical protein
VITGVIDAAAKGPYAELDADGRYRVRFLFDAGDAGDGQASRLCRMAQPHGGGGYGMHFPLRSGVEVILTFVEGDPDRPIILGVVPNPQTPSPVTGGNGTRNIIRTGGGNEINIDDTAGAERIKISSPFGRSSFQIGEKNCPEQGLVACSDESASTVTKKTINVMTPAANTIADYIKALCAEDITYYCSAAVNFLAKADAWLTVGGDALEAVKASRDELSGYSAWSLTLEAAHKELQVKLSQKKDEVRAQQDHTKEHALEAELASVDAELGTIQRTTVEAIERANTLDAKKLALQEELHAERERIEAKVVEDASVQALDAKVSAAKDHQEQVEDAKAADDEADWTKKAAEDLKTYGIDPVKSLVSTFSAYGGWVAQNTATAKTTAAAGAGTSTASLGTIKSTVGPFMGPAFTGGADWSAALVGGVNAVVYGGLEASLVSICEAGVFGGTTAVLKSKGASEVYATVKTLVGAGGTITIESGASTSIESGTSTNVEAQTGLSLSAREANVVINADSENVIVNAKKNVQVTGQAEINQASPKITLKAETSELVLDDAKATAKLGRGDWSFVANASSVLLGNGASYYRATDGEVELSDGTGTLSFKGGNLNVDGGTLTLKGSGTAKLDGNKIFIG